MKIPTTSLMAIVIAIITVFYFDVSAQDAWSTDGNVADSTSFIGTINNHPLLIKTDSIDRIIIGINDNIEFKP